jgi:hypothetical protein
MNEYQSLTSLVLTNPLFSAAIAAVIVIAGFRRWRADAPLWASVKLLSKQQYLIARQPDVDALLRAAGTEGKRDLAERQLDELRKRYPSGLRVGHLWWTWWQVRGLVGGHVAAPPCTCHEDGLSSLTKGRLDMVPLDQLMKRWR